MAGAVAAYGLAVGQSLKHQHLVGEGGEDTHLVTALFGQSGGCPGHGYPASPGHEAGLTMVTDKFETIHSGGLTLRGRVLVATLVTPKRTWEWGDENGRTGPLTVVLGRRKWQE